MMEGGSEPELQVPGPHVVIPGDSPSLGLLSVVVMKSEIIALRGATEHRRHCFKSGS